MILSLWLWGGLGITGLMLFGFILGQVRKDNSLVDILWGLAQVAGIVAALAWLGRIPQEPIFWVWSVTLLVWALRLSGHIGWRNTGKGEDPRYQGFRSSWGTHQVLGALFQVYLLQGILAMVIFGTHGVALGGIVAGSQGSGTVFFVLGLVLWIVGFSFEALGDFQLLQFKKNPENKGKLMTEGVWSWTRHPNYFGEACLWWGWGVGALGFGGLPFPGLVGLIGPVVVTFLLLRISGVPMTEARYAGRSDFVEYAARTSKFFPWPPKRGRKDR